MTRTRALEDIAVTLASRAAAANARRASDDFVAGLADNRGVSRCSIAVGSVLFTLLLACPGGGETSGTASTPGAGGSEATSEPTATSGPTTGSEPGTSAATVDPATTSA